MLLISDKISPHVAALSPAYGAELATRSLTSQDRDFLYERGSCHLLKSPIWRSRIERITLDVFISKIPWSIVSGIRTIFFLLFSSSIHILISCSTQELPRESFDKTNINLSRKRMLSSIAVMI